MSGDSAGDCTSIMGLDLKQLAKRINIGREEYWGTTSTVWLALFYVHCVAFVILFTIIICWCVLFLWEKLQSWRRQSSFLYLLCIYCFMWSFTSLLHYILLAVGVISHPPNQKLTTATYSLELIAVASSMNGLLIIAVYQYYRLRFRSYQSLKKCVLLTGPAVVIAAIIITIVSIPVDYKAVVAIVVLVLILMFIGMMGTTGLVAMYVELWFRTNSSRSLQGSMAGRSLILKLIIRLLSYLYLVIVPVHLLLPFVKMVIEGDCVEEAQGNRATWLSIQTVIKLAELFLVTQCLDVPQKVQKFLRNLCTTKQTKKQLSLVDPVPKKSPGSLDDLCIVETTGGVFQAINSASEMDKTNDLREVGFKSNTPQHELNNPLEVMLDNNDPGTTELPCQPVELASIIPFNSTALIEKEYLPQASSINVDKELKEESYSGTMVSNRFNYDFQDSQLLSSVFDELWSRYNRDLYTPSLMNSLSVEIVSAHAPLDTDNLVGSVEIGMFDERGGVFHSHKHGATILLPAGAIPSGILAELKFAATLVAPVKLISNKSPVSAIFWLCMDIVLQKPIQVRLPHFVNIENQSQTRSLQFLKSTHSPVDVTEEIMGTVIEGEFPAGESYGSIDVNHFCYYCIVEDKLECSRIPCNRYVAVAMSQRQPRNRLWSVHICILPLLKTCIEKLKEQYGYDWKYESLREFSFPQGCEHITIEFKSHPFQGDAVIEVLTDDKINQRDIDFQHYYDKDESVLDQLRLLMDEKLYPPRFKAMLQAKHKDFFESSNWLYYQLTCGTEIIKGKLVVPGRDTSTFTTSCSESDSSLKMNKYGSNTSGYDSLGGFSEDDELNSENLQLRNLMLQTMVIKSKWFELGMALYVPIDKLERLYDKYSDNPVKALVRVLRYWLADKNGLKPSWEKLIAALQDIKEYSLAIGLEKSISADHPAVFHDDIEPEKELVMKHVRLELINLTALIPVLNKHNLLTLDDNYKLLNYSVSPLERANLLLYMIIPSKGPGAFKRFITCLQEETEHIGHQELAKMLTAPMKATKRAVETTV